jgi:hypothetical protein
MGVNGWRHAPAALCPGERTFGTHCIGAGWASEPVWTQRLEEKSFAPAGDRTPVFQFLDTADWATPVPNLPVVICKTYL